MIVDYKLNYNALGEKRKYRLTGKKRSKVIDSSSWIENDLKNQWCFKDYKCYYIIVSQYSLNKFRATCSGAFVGEYSTLEEAKVAAIRFCDKIIQ